MKRVVIILLAGGKASRYNLSLKSQTNNHYDKLLSNRANNSLIKFVTSELNPLGDIIIVTRGEKRKQHYAALLEDVSHNKGIKVISEDSEESIGPMGGIYSAVKICKNYQTKVVLPTDLPNVKQGIIEDLIKKASQDLSFDLVSLVHPSGQTENLVFAGHGNEILRVSQLLIQAGIYRVSSLFRLISKTRFLNSSCLTEDLDVEEVFSDLDSSNSVSLGTKSTGKAENIHIVKSPFVDFGVNGSEDDNHKDPSRFYRQFVEWKSSPFDKNQQKRVPSIVSSLLKESKIYRVRGLLSLSLHCLLDAYEISKDPIIADQIDELKDQLGK